ncbi:MAG TPA: carbonic anhydrase [Pyrinomonadaceae bacterium]|nr:carbonic anhydrase [Pyrinomonadaceae bacterium]
MFEPDLRDFESYVSTHIFPGASKAAGVPLLLLQCMDSRYPHRILQTMDSLGLRGKYDQLILAGASLGVVLPKKPDWQSCFLDHLDFAITEHHVSEVLILDHRDCGAYKAFLGITPDDPKVEKQAHVEKCKEAIAVIVKRFPQLRKVHSLLLPIENVEPLVAWPE